MTARQRLHVGAVILMVALSCTACSTLPSPPAAVGDDYPGTCMPAEFSWPSDFLESLPGEPTAVGGRIVGLRLEYVDAQWMWRLRSTDTKRDFFGERVDDPGFGKEALVDARTLQTVATRSVELTDAEQQSEGSSASAAAKLSGEQWPSPLIIEMMRVIDDDVPVWQITTCDTATSEQSKTTID